MDLRIDLKSTGGANKLNPPMNNQKDAISQKIFDRGSEIFNLIETDTTSVFNKDWWYGRIMDWSMKNEAFKVQMFRFVDVLPYLNSSSEVARHLKEYFADMGDEASSIL